MTEIIFEHIKRCKILADVHGVKGERVVPLAKALKDGGIDCITVHFDPSGAQSDHDVAAQISMLSSFFKGSVCVGAGTVRTAQQVTLAASAGADYIVSVSANPEVIEMADELTLLSIVGAFTPSEIETAHRYGADIVNLFPASFLGTEYLDEIRRSLSDIPLMASGGISVWNMRAFLDAGCMCVSIAGNLVQEVFNPECDFGIIEETAKAYRAIADNDRKPRNRNL